MTEPLIQIGRYPYHLIPVQVAAALLMVVMRIFMFVLGLPACAIGVIGLRRMFAFTSPSGNRFPHYLWPWDSRVSTTPESWWWESDRWQHKLGWRFSTWWWRAIRNPASNFSRANILGSDDFEDWDYVRTTEGSTQGPITPEIMSKKTVWQVRWSLKHWWLAGWQVHHKWNKARYLQVKVGFKLHSVYEGLGFTVRLIPYRMIDRL